MAIDGTVATEGAGDKFSATVNGEATNDEKRELKKGDVIEIANGADTTETFQSSTEEVPFTRVEDENYWNGSLHVYIPGVNGVRTTKTGDVSGITLVEDTQPVVNEEYKIYNANVGDDKVIALTFDDGPWPDSTGQILDILDQYDAKATFFTIGNQIEQHADMVKRAHDAGHQICTHTWDHASGSGQGVNLTYMTAEEQISEVQKGMEAISSATGARCPAPSCARPAATSSATWCGRCSPTSPPKWAGTSTPKTAAPGRRRHRRAHRERPAGRRHPHARRRRRPLADRRSAQAGAARAQGEGLPVRHRRRAFGLPHPHEQRIACRAERAISGHAGVRRAPPAPTSPGHGRATPR